MWCGKFRFLMQKADYVYVSHIHSTEVRSDGSLVGEIFRKSELFPVF